MPHSPDRVRCIPGLAVSAAQAGFVAAVMAIAVPAGAQDQTQNPQAQNAQPQDNQAQNQQPQSPAQDQSFKSRYVPPTFADLAAKQVDTVVFISTSQAAPQAQGGGRGQDMPEFPPGSPFEEFFREFRDRQRGQPQQQRPTAALGSGFIIDAAGFVVTNGHVVSEADEISVTLHDGTKLPAKLVGSDAPTDLALLKVESRKPLTAASWGNSDQTRIGDWVVAIGNPFGLGGSVTAGILSARARDIQQGPYDDYLQTDASINRGNSGGPLYNMSGEVIGINTAIYSPTGGSVGIGFAIPSTIARPVIEQLKDRGQVRRGWLGVQVQRVTPDIADSLGMPEPKGALVTSVSPDSPAGQGGIRQGDIITSFNGKPVEQMRELPRIVAATEIGRKVPMDVLREGKPQTLDVTVGELAQQQQVAAAGSSGDPRQSAPVESKKVLGLTLSPLTPGLREAFSINGDIEGIVVTEVGDRSPATERGIEAGDVIVEAGQEPVKTPEELDKRIQEARAQGRKTVLMLVSRDGDLRYVPMPIEEKKG